jgi:hypothetical protein
MCVDLKAKRGRLGAHPPLHRFMHTYMHAHSFAHSLTLILLTHTFFPPTHAHVHTHVQEEWERELEKVAAQLREAVVELSKRRREAAGRLSGGVERCLKELSMKGSRFECRLEWRRSKTVRAWGVGGKLSMKGLSHLTH